MLYVLIVGVVSGWLAGQFMRGKGFGLPVDLLLGIVGSIIGGFVFSLLGIQAYGLLGRIIVATAGAVGLLYVARKTK